MRLSRFRDAVFPLGAFEEELPLELDFDVPDDGVLAIYSRVTSHSGQDMGEFKSPHRTLQVDVNCG